MCRKESLPTETHSVVSGKCLHPERLHPTALKLTEGVFVNSGPLKLPLSLSLPFLQVWEMSLDPVAELQAHAKETARTMGLLSVGT